MNFYTDNEDIKEKVVELLDDNISSEGVVNFSVSYSHNRHLSLVVIEMSQSTIIHSLMFIYTRALSLYDVQRYTNKIFHRINFGGNDFKKIDSINKFILKNIARSNPVSNRKLKEAVIENMKDDAKDYQIEKLKDQLRIARDQIQSLRNQIKFVKNSRNPS